MGNFIKKLSGDDSKPIILLPTFSRPDNASYFDSREKLSGRSFNPQYRVTDLDPYRQRFESYNHPIVREIRARTKPPNEQEIVKRSLMELLLEWAEQELEK